MFVDRYVPTAVPRVTSLIANQNIEFVVIPRWNDVRRRYANKAVKFSFENDSCYLWQWLSISGSKGPLYVHFFFHFDAHLGLVLPVCEIVVADPGFPKRVGGGAPTPKVTAQMYYFGHFFRKTTSIWKKLEAGGAGDT